MWLSRFERKILLAMAVVALVPLVATLVLGATAVREAYRVGVNERVGAQLEQALEIYRDHFVTLRNSAERTADAVARDWRLHELLREGTLDELEAHLEGTLSRYPNVAAVAIREPGASPMAQAERDERLDTSRMRLLTQQRALEGVDKDLAVEVTIATPAAPFRAYQQAGEVQKVYARLQASTEYVSNYYLFVYLAFLVSVVAIAVGVGFVLSRRVTRRVADLAEATRRVGAGDLTVEVPTHARDEVGELTRAFNDMVRDLRESRDRIEYLQRIGAWQEFARRLAHEIKNPLTPIQLAAQQMWESYDGGDERYRRNLERACGIIEEEVSTLRRLVSEFSAFAKLPEARLSAADLRDFVGEVERAVPGVLEDLGLTGDQIAITCHQGSDSMPVRIDSMMLKRCVDNLIRNSVHAVRGLRPDGGGRVVVEAYRTQSRAVLEVRDNGPGVPAKDRGRVFDPYYTSKSEGTGLGLAIVKKVVLEHGGEVEYADAPEGGATFRMRLPLDASRGSRSSRRISNDTND